MTYRFVAYIPWEKIEEYTALGWTVRPEALSGTPHCEFAVIGEYVTDRDEEPPVPVLRRDAEDNQPMSVGAKC